MEHMELSPKSALWDPQADTLDAGIRGAHSSHYALARLRAPAVLHYLNGVRIHSDEGHAYAPVHEEDELPPENYSAGPSQTVTASPIAE